MSAIDPEVRALVDAFIAKTKTGRAVAALRIMLDRGSVTTDDLKALGYEHPPRAIADVRDNGIPIITERDTSAQSKRMARYRLGTAENIRVGQIGRTNFSKSFRNELLDHYGSRDAITCAEHDPRALQIDHRVPYRIAGDSGLGNIAAFMLLDGKSQRSKSWSCEHCQNFLELLDPAICQGCFWAFPEDYRHVAMLDIRRAEVVWQGKEVGQYDQLAQRAAEAGLSIAELIKQLGILEIEREI